MKFCAKIVANDLYLKIQELKHFLIVQVKWLYKQKRVK